MKRAITPLLIAALMLSIAGAAQSEPSEPVTREEMLRVRALREETEAMRVALAEAAQYDRMRAEAFRRALAAADGDAAAAEPTASVRTASTVTDDGAKTKATRERKPARHRKKQTPPTASTR